jgi:hypothetical protein
MEAIEGRLPARHPNSRQGFDSFDLASVVALD